MTISYEDYKDVKNIMVKSSCIAIGPGMGKNNNTEELLRKIIRDYNKTMVIDADGINVLENNLDIIKKAKRRNSFNSTFRGILKNNRL